MTPTILILLVLVIVILLLTRKSRVLRQAQDKIVGICSTALEQTVKKSANKEKILALLSGKGEVSNTDIREELGVSAASVVRYMDELEKAGAVRQVGRTGKHVLYKKV